MPSQASRPKPPGWDKYLESVGGNTDILSSKVAEFVDSSSAGSPFFAYLAPFAPHFPSAPAPRHFGLYDSLPAYHPPNFNIPEPGKSPFDEAIIPNIDNYRRRALESLQAVDEMVADLTSRLRNRSILDNTVIVFTSAEVVERKPGSPGKT